jgi:DHA2 family methylenomycin A resistance protein-like MFS transporter
MFQEDRRIKLFTIGAMCFGLFMVMLDNTVVNLALPTIQRELTSGLTGLQWIVDAFTLLLASLMLTGGTLGDLFGRKRIFMAGLAIFTAGSLLCALSPTIGVLIGGRAVQGLGAAIMMPSTLAILTNTFHDPKERAQAIGIWAGVSGVALALGPVLGGVMVDSFGWQSIFYLNVPIGLAALAITARVVRESKNPQARGLDLPGQVFAATGLASLTYSLIEANNYGWGSARIVTLLIVAGVALAGFALRETRARNPMLQLSFFKNVTFTGANIVGLLVSFGFFGILFFMALFMQNVQGFSATGAGVRQLPATLAVMVVAIIAGRIVGRIGARLPMTVGMFFLGTAILLFQTVQATTPYSAYWWILVIQGIGAGLVFSPMSTAVMSTVPAARAGMGSATFNTSRQVGGVFGIALLGSIVTGGFATELKRSLGALGLPPAVTDQIAVAAKNGRGSGTVPSIPGVDVAAVQTAINNSFTTSLHRGLLICGIVVLIGAVVSVVTIRGTSPDAQLARKAAAETAAVRATPVPSRHPAASDLPAEQPE